MLAATGSSVPLLPIGVLAALLLAAGIVLRRRMA
ncbi:LPXTG cell wall anchor domain-containing protein [Salinibacterium sp. PAMC 21357]